jgi:hypothetical protein
VDFRGFDLADRVAGRRAADFFFAVAFLAPPRFADALRAEAVFAPRFAAFLAPPFRDEERLLLLRELFLAAIVLAPVAVGESESTLQEAGTSLGPCLLLRVGFSEDCGENRIGVFGFHDHVDRIGDWRDATEVAVTRISVAEAPRTSSRELTDPDVRQRHPGECVKDIQLSGRR